MNTYTIQVVAQTRQRSVSSSSARLDEQAFQVEIMAPLLLENPLPDNESLLQAVLKACPMLQTLLLAGPLHQWRHPHRHLIPLRSLQSQRSTSSVSDLSYQ
ncbi:hypothetical protein HA466_0172470 [Hirschfeldia incana]|nr:hypothetical protein HA466_0172470 [Hirschfeldia incana]KAJ0246750.1 hypothetical protein HA466_0172470 [Hirschfeldia incana]